MSKPILLNDSPQLVIINVNRKWKSASAKIYIDLKI